MSELKLQPYLDKIELTKQRIQNKTFVEKTAIQGLCLLGTRIAELQNYVFLDKMQKKANRKRFYQDFKKKNKQHKKKIKKKKFIKKKKIVVQLEQPIGDQGELKIKKTHTLRNSSCYACPSSYPFHLFKKQQKPNFLENKKKIQKVIVRNI
ncbi:hypothetical protein M0813_13529 [Anaeramoeba flamelloides]|uniref:Uncharacterized protein n=1 Tax=Anaeramoeba flamelloides TaxID=1746091 RepID=A0AAV7ZEN4_9EUKA|nr:hypothetical protein M0812_15231 [Anaeramoeba flamelloides]KAJ6253034.1 hypothetical protein M0813_13529 [Anaeramoeba flamelloides]